MLGGVSGPSNAGRIYYYARAHSLAGPRFYTIGPPVLITIDEGTFPAYWAHNVNEQNLTNAMLGVFREKHRLPLRHVSRRLG